MYQSFSIIVMYFKKQTKVCHKAAHKGDKALPIWSVLSCCVPAFPLISFSSVACMWHSSSAEPHKSSAATSVKPCLQISNILSFSPG